jgi:hypothetical protein
LDGEKLLGTAGIALSVVGEQAREPTPAIPFTSPPNRGFVAFKPDIDRTSPFARGDSHHDLGPLHLKPGQGPIMRGGMQSILILWSNC